MMSHIYTLSDIIGDVTRSVHVGRGDCSLGCCLFSCDFELFMYMVCLFKDKL